MVGRVQQQEQQQEQEHRGPAAEAGAGAGAAAGPAAGGAAAAAAGAAAAGAEKQGRSSRGAERKAERPPPYQMLRSYSRVYIGTRAWSAPRAAQLRERVSGNGISMQAGLKILDRGSRVC